MIQTLLFSYLIFLGLSLLGWRVMALEGTKRSLGVLVGQGLALFTAFLCLLLVGQLLWVWIQVELLERSQLPNSPLGTLLSGLTGEPKAQVFVTWWQEELRFWSLSLLVVALVLVGIKGRGVELGSDRGLGTWRGLGQRLVGFLILGLPMVALLFAAGLWRTKRSVLGVGAQWSDLFAGKADGWRWAGSDTLVGWGHVWAFDLSLVGLAVTLWLYLLIDLGRYRVGQKRASYAGD